MIHKSKSMSNAIQHGNNRVSTNEPKDMLGFILMLAGGALVIGDTIVQLFVGKKEAEAKAYGENRKADGDLYEKKAQVDVEKAKAMYDIRQNGKGETTAQPEHGAASNTVDEEPPRTSSWLKDFKSKHKMPALPPIVGPIVKAFPEGFQDAIMMAQLSGFGAMAFSKVRAMFSDSVLHAPNIQVIVEAPSGSGKGKIKFVLDRLFERVYNADTGKLNDHDQAKHIVQTMGAHTSQAAYFERLLNNQGVHNFLFEEEISTAVRARSSSTGLDMDYYCKAFDNGLVQKNTMNHQGRTNIFMNFVLTGPRVDVNRFVRAKDVEGGPASRMAFCTLEQDESGMPNFNFDESELEVYRNMIDQWRKKYCYTTDATGKDTACPETKANLDYVREALDRWVKKQKHLADSEEQSVRDIFKERFSAAAFNCAIVIAGLYDFKNDSSTRTKVVDLAIYIADYYMERFLKKYGEEAQKINDENLAAEQVFAESNEDNDSVCDKETSLKMLLKYERGVYGYQRIAKEFNLYCGKYHEPDGKKVQRSLQNLAAAYGCFDAEGNPDIMEAKNRLLNGTL